MRKRIETVYHSIVKCLFFILGYFPKKKLLFFESFHGKQYSDNPRAIYEYVRNNHPDYQCIWAVKKGYEAYFDSYKVPYVRRLGVRWLLTMPRATYWIFNTRMPSWMKKSQHTVYVQTWHGTPLKKLGLDIEAIKMPGINTVEYQQDIIQEASRWDILISPNAYSTECFRSAFAYEGKILETGYPRNDVLVRTENKEAYIRSIKKKLGIEEKKKVILYAPTWRDDHYFSQGAYRYENHFPFQEMLHADKDLVIVTRLHYLIAEKLDISSYGSAVIDGSAYEDIRDLYMIADILITDYSSVMFDFALTDKPMLFYMYDYKNYEEAIRGFYFDPHTILPGPIVMEEEVLVSEVLAILNGTALENDIRYSQFKRQFVHLSETSSAEEVITYVFGMESK
ncbi:CDP-glycerol glycerophosphotransferase family protein [Candidatus Enterococcus clewellii]|uniref:CDP-glycerol glycerophosphotransferase n=1 Tax=Candidatus Enterococcus clewellii TaxID=1834193 RepID=A0A242JXI3_9ENTE|nr:CDP-glycerol glycerophosphotransferase family protein [Enterococcus sp. 9E7_DIV0242]OTP09829.1 hypothetical protein A5888_004025 [Enterococcus sp. 9E7_DIV0242]